MDQDAMRTFSSHYLLGILREGADTREESSTNLRLELLG